MSASVGIKPSVSFAEPSSKDISNTMEWGSVEIGGGGFVTGIITGQKEMYLRTDVGGAYKYNYETNRWDQLFAFINEADRGLLSVKGIAIDPTDDDTVYFLCGCAYFSDARTEIIKTTDGGKTFTRVDVTDMIQVHGNGDGRECSEPIAIDPDDPDIIYQRQICFPERDYFCIKESITVCCHLLTAARHGNPLKVMTTLVCIKMTLNGLHGQII